MADKHKTHRQPKAYRRPTSSDEVRARIRAAGAQRVCLHPEASPGHCDAIIAAHTVQRSRVLEAILDDDRHVSTFHVFQGRTSRSELGVSRVGWKEASTFTGFCAKHDASTFAPLENAPFVGSDEQCFLHAYRAVCREWFAKSSMLQASPAMRDMFPPNDTEGEAFVGSHVRGSTRGLADLKCAKDLLDAALVKREYSAINFLLVDFGLPLCIASTGAFIPETTISGEELQSLSDLSVDVEWISMSTEIGRAHV